MQATIMDKISQYQRCPFLGVPLYFKGTMLPYKRIFSNGSRMGIPNYTWVSGVLMS